MKKTTVILHHWAINTERMTREQILNCAQRIHTRKTGYHISIFPDGYIYQIRNASVMIGHTLAQKHEVHPEYYNRVGVGVAFAGNYQEQEATRNQKYAFWQVYDRLWNQFSRALMIREHRELSFTACPASITTGSLNREVYGDQKTFRLQHGSQFVIKDGKGYVQLRTALANTGMEMVGWDQWTKEPIMRQAGT